jgi:hypothetical protein
MQPTSLENTGIEQCAENVQAVITYLWALSLLLT